MMQATLDLIRLAIGRSPALLVIPAPSGVAFPMQLNPAPKEGFRVSRTSRGGSQIWF
jgi:hypothetical protein